MQAKVKIVRNSDDTITIRVGHNVEHISTFEKDKYQIFESVKYALIAQGISLLDSTIIKMIEDA